jgi:hypothetical protein
MQQRSRISRGHRRKRAAYRVVATTPSCLLFEFPRREQPAAERLPQGHFQLLGLQFPGYVDERSRWGGQGESFAPNRGDPFPVGAGVDDDAGRTANAAISASEEQVDRVGK